MNRLLFAALLALACQRVPDDGPPLDPSEGTEPSKPGVVHRFVFGTTQGEELSADSVRGRTTVLLFVTTFDLASQVAAKRLNQVLHTHTPRINAAAVVLEAAKYAMLADVFRTSLELSYPVAIADLGTLQQNSTFGEVSSVPALLILDREGRELQRRSGTFTVEELDEWLSHVERR